METKHSTRGSSCGKRREEFTMPPGSRKVSGFSLSCRRGTPLLFGQSERCEDRLELRAHRQREVLAARQLALEPAPVDAAALGARGEAPESAVDHGRGLRSAAGK